MVHPYTVFLLGTGLTTLMIILALYEHKKKRKFLGYPYVSFIIPVYKNSAARQTLNANNPQFCFVSKNLNIINTPRNVNCEVNVR